MRLFFTKPKAVLGVAISETTLSLVELSHINQQWRLLRYGMAALKTGEIIDNQIIDSEQLGQRIAALVHQIQTKTKLAATALSANLVLTREIELGTDFSEQDIEAQIRVDADQYIPYPLSEASLDFEVMGPSHLETNLNKVLLVVSRTEYIEQYSDTLVFGGLQPKIIDIDPEALQRAFRLIIGSDNQYPEVTALIDIGSTRTTVYVADNSKFVFQLEQLFGDSHLLQAIETEYDLSPAEAEQAKLTPELFEDYNQRVFEPFIQNLSQYLNRAFEQSLTVPGSTKVQHIFLCGRAALLAQIDSRLQQQIGLPVTLANPFKAMSLDSSIDSEQLSKDAPQLMSACGLSMRSQLTGLNN